MNDDDHSFIDYYCKINHSFCFVSFIITGCIIHGPAFIAFHCSHLYITTNPESVSHFAKTWVSLQTATYIKKSTKYLDILSLLTCEEVLHAPTVQI